jgi:hypothetical protein
MTNEEFTPGGLRRVAGLIEAVNSYFGYDKSQALDPGTLRQEADRMDAEDKRDSRADVTDFVSAFAKFMDENADVIQLVMNRVRKK